MAGGALVLISCGALTVWINHRQVPDQGRTAQRAAERPLGKEGGFELIFRNRYLMSIAALVVLLNIVNTPGEFLLSKLVVTEAARAFPGAAAAAARERFIGEFYGSFFGWVNITLFAGPTIALIGYSAILVAPLLGFGALSEDPRQ